MMNKIDIDKIETLLGDPVNPPPGTRGEMSVVASVEEIEGGWGIGYGHSGSTHFSLLRRHMRWGRDKVVPVVGDNITVYTVGSSIVGVDLRGERLYRRSEREMNADWVLYRARHEREQHEDFECNEPKLNAEYEALPQLFKDRIDRFRANNPKFRMEFESYEMFCCTEAVKLAEAAKRGVRERLYAPEINAFWADLGMRQLAAYPSDDAWEEPDNAELRWLGWAQALNSKAFNYDYKRQREVLGLSDEHSGNTAGAAFMLAKLYLASPENVARMHGALSPLVGSEAYGDLPQQ